jgi:hypothetical protein
MGILRKLAELVVEFPEEQQATAPKQSEEDVLASIERIRSDIEADVKQIKPKFEDAAAETQPTAAPASGATAAASSGTASGIRVPPILSVDEIYAKAELAPAEGKVDVYRVEQMLSDPEIADLPLETRARSVRMALRSMGIELPDLLADAGRRDQALEAYEQFLGEAFDEVSRQVSEANAQLQLEIDEFVRSRTAQIEANRSALEQARAGVARFSDAKAAEERRLFNTVAPFVAPGQNPVQLSGNAPGEPKGGNK